MKKKVLHLINRNNGPTVPTQVANRLTDEFDVYIVSLYYTTEEAKREAESEIPQVLGIGLKNKFNLLKYIKLFKVVKQINPDIIHVHHTLSVFLGRIIGKLSRGMKVISTVHNDMKFFNFYQKLLQSINLNFSDAIICNSENTKLSFAPWQDRLIDPNKKEVIYNGVEVDKISNTQSNTREKYGIKKDEFLIGNVAMLEKQKDQTTLIKAFAQMINQTKKAKLIIVGAGTLEDKLKSLTCRLNLRDKVIFTGLVPRREVYEIINALDLFIMPSIYEGFCNAMVEAMAAANAVIAADISPLPEVLGEKNGLFFAKQDIDDLTDKILKLYNNSRLRDQLGQRAKEYAVSNYSLTKCVQQHKKVYQRLLNVSQEGKNV